MVAVTVVELRPRLGTRDSHSGMAPAPELVAPRGVLGNRAARIGLFRNSAFDSRRAGGGKWKWAASGTEANRRHRLAEHD